MADAPDTNLQQESRRPCVACCEPIFPQARTCPHCGTEQRPVPSLWKRFGTILKWVGGITAILSLIASTIQLNGLWQNARDTSRAVEGLLRASEIQQQAGQLDVALDLVRQALELEPGSSSANHRQSAIAMLLIRQYNIYFGFEHGDEINPLLEILYRGSGQREPRDGADVVAHIGLATLLASSSSAASHGERSDGW